MRYFCLNKCGAFILSRDSAYIELCQLDFDTPTIIAFPSVDIYIRIWDNFLIVDGDVYSVRSGKGLYNWPCPDIVLKMGIDYDYPISKLESLNRDVKSGIFGYKSSITCDNKLLVTHGVSSPRDKSMSDLYYIPGAGVICGRGCDNIHDKLAEVPLPILNSDLLPIPELSHRNTVVRWVCRLASRVKNAISDREVKTFLPIACDITDKQLVVLYESGWLIHAYCPIGDDWSTIFNVYNVYKAKCGNGRGVSAQYLEYGVIKVLDGDVVKHYDIIGSVLKESEGRISGVIDWSNISVSEVGSSAKRAL